MNVIVRSIGIDSPEALRSYAERRVLFALARLLGTGATALVRISDLNGPRGGLDKRCRITVRGPGLTGQAEATDADARAAIDHACDRLARVLRDERERTRMRFRRDRGSVRRAIGSDTVVDAGGAA